MTATPTPTAPSHLVISEFRSRGLNGTGSDDEFVELYNPTGAAVNIGGWTIRKSSGCGTTISTLVTITSGTTLLPGQHFLAASNSNSSLTGADQTFSPSIADNGGVALLDSSGMVVDQAGMCASTLFREGAFLTPLAGTSDQSYEREPGGNTACYDTDDNANDFALISPANPQNLASPAVMCSGVLTAMPTSTASQTPMPTLSPTAADTSTPTQTATVTTMSTPTASMTATPTPVAPDHLVISEFRSRGPNGTDDEFVELYNPTGAAANIGGWSIKRSSSCGTTIYNLVTIASNVILQPGQHFLAASSSNSSLTGADQTFSPAIADDGGVALVNLSGTIVDQAGMCISTQYREGANLIPLSGTTNQSYERRPGGDTACYDTDNNAGDFALLSPANPQNLASPAVMCFGVPISTPIFTPTPTPTRTATPLPTAYPSTVVINEFLPHPRSDWNEDGVANTGDEYIELINMGVDSINLKGWKLDDGDGGSSPFTLPDLTLLPRQIVHFYGSQTGISLSDGGDTVRLINPDGRTADIVNYPVVKTANQTWCRLPDGNGAWGFVCYPTPERPNTLVNSATASPGAGPVTEEDSVCPLADTVPQPVRLVECEGFGSGVWDSLREEQFWLQSRWKWDVFVE
jgi:hypothetical protein